MQEYPGKYMSQAVLIKEFVNSRVPRGGLRRVTDDQRPEGPAVVVNPTIVAPPSNGTAWGGNTPAAVSITGILATAVLEGLAIQKGLDGSHFYTALGIIGTICGIHVRFAPLLAGYTTRR